MRSKKWNEKENINKKIFVQNIKILLKLTFDVLHILLIKEYLQISLLSKHLGNKHLPKIWHCHILVIKAPKLHAKKLEKLMSHFLRKITDRHTDRSTDKWRNRLLGEMSSY